MPKGETAVRLLVLTQGLGVQYKGLGRRRDPTHSERWLRTRCPLIVMYGFPQSKQIVNVCITRHSANVAMPRTCPLWNGVVCCIGDKQIVGTLIQDLLDFSCLNEVEPSKVLPECYGDSPVVGRGPVQSNVIVLIKVYSHVCH